MRVSEFFPLSSSFKLKLSKWAAAQEVCFILNSNRDKQLFTDKYFSHDFLIAAGCIEEITAKSEQPFFEALRDFHHRANDWLFGYLTYDLKNELEDLSSENFDGLQFPSVHFFQPRYLLKIENEILRVEYVPEHDSEDSILTLVETIEGFDVTTDFQKNQPISINQRISKAEYISTVNKIKQHIQQGDIYEMNYCIEFYAEDAVVDMFEIYTGLNVASPMPFSCFYKSNQHYLACASPERFLAKRGNKIISQPIKGTAPRGKTKEEDSIIKQQLQNDPKERSENIMIVDLVRNDLSKTAARNSVQIEELAGIYTFNQLHQMISTIISTIRNDVQGTDVIKNAFPMGSMTGAPKIRAMQLIEKYETTKRGLYSGTVGYITPEGDFDFNVVIRSVLYNEEKKYLSFMAGSAITADSDAEKEYRECLLKSKAMLQVLASVNAILHEYANDQILNS